MLYNQGSQFFKVVIPCVHFKLQIFYFLARLFLSDYHLSKKKEKRINSIEQIVNIVH